MIGKKYGWTQVRIKKLTHTYEDTSKSSGSYKCMISWWNRQLGSPQHIMEHLGSSPDSSFLPLSDNRQRLKQSGPCHPYRRPRFESYFLAPGLARISPSSCGRISRESVDGSFLCLSTFHTNKVLIFMESSMF